MIKVSKRRPWLCYVTLHQHDSPTQNCFQSITHPELVRSWQGQPFTIQLLECIFLNNGDKQKRVQRYKHFQKQKDVICNTNMVDWADLS